MSSQPVAAAGEQRPRILTAPPATSSAGQEAVELAAIAGLHLDPWQAFALDQALAERDGGRWASFEVGLVVSRQNGKNSVVEARELAGLFLFGDELVLHSAHRWDTSVEAFLRLLQLIESTPDLDQRVQRVSRAHGEEGVQLRSGQRIRYKARSGQGGRGFSGDLVVLDEAMYLPQAVMGALMPTMSARPNPQLWYTASAVDVAEHEHGQVLAAVRDRALAGGDPSLTYLEWSPDIDHPDKTAGLTEQQLEAAIRAANPALGVRLSREHIDNERRSMGARAFAVERLGVGSWPKPEKAQHVIDRETWAARGDEQSVPLDPVAFAVDVTPDRSRASISTAAWRGDGRVHVEVIEDREGTGWIAERLIALVGSWDPCALVVDGRSPAASLVAELEAEDLEVDVTHAGHMSAAVGGFYDDVLNDRLRYRDPLGVLTTALEGAGTRALGESWAWDRRGKTQIAPLVAATLARWGLVMKGRIAPPPPPLVVPVASAERTVGTADLMTAGF